MFGEYNIFHSGIYNFNLCSVGLCIIFNSSCCLHVFVFGICNKCHYDNILFIMKLMILFIGLGSVLILLNWSEGK
jgi:hypothetical protein